MTPVELVCDIDFVLHLQHFRPWPTDGPPHVTSCQKPDQSAHRTASGCKRQPGAELDSYCCQRGTGIPAVCLLPGQMLPFQLCKFQWVDAHICVDRPSRSCGTVGWSKVSVGWPDTSVCVCIFRRAALFQLGRCFIWSRPAAWRVFCTCPASPPLSASATTLHIWHSLAITSTQ